MKRILSLSLTLAIFLTFTACKKSDIQSSKANGEPDDTNSIKLNADNVKYMISATKETLFVVNPDKTVSVVGINNGACNVEEWVDIEKIFATETATYGIQSDGTCLVAENFTSSTIPEYNNAREITDNFVLFEDGTVIPKNATFKNETLPKCVDIVQKPDYRESGEFMIVTENGKICAYEFELDPSHNKNYCWISSNDYDAEDLNNNFKEYFNVKELTYYNSNLSAVRHDGKVYGGKYSSYSEKIIINEYVNQWNNVNSCVPVGDDIFIAITNDKKVLACGREFSKLGGETPKLLTIDNALRVFALTAKHNGKSSNYAIILCEDGSVYAYCLGAMHTNTANAFSKWKSFEVL